MPRNPSDSSDPCRVAHPLPHFGKGGVSLVKTSDRLRSTWQQCSRNNMALVHRIVAVVAVVVASTIAPGFSPYTTSQQSRGLSSEGAPC